jgi:hypothetical protein
VRTLWPIRAFQSLVWRSDSLIYKLLTASATKKKIDLTVDQDDSTIQEVQFLFVRPAPYVTRKGSSRWQQ